MEIARTGSYEYDNVTTEERRSVIIEKIQEKIQVSKSRLNDPISDKDAYIIAGRIDALESLNLQIISIQENSVSLVDPSSTIIGVPQYLTTDNKFLNAAYWTAMEIKNNERGFDGSVASSNEGEIGKRKAMSEMMFFIKSLS